MYKKSMVFLVLILLSLILLSGTAMAANEPTLLNVTNIAQRSISIEWINNSVQYNTSVFVDGVSVANITAKDGTGRQSYTITGLTKGTSYVIGIKSYAAGYTSLSSIVSTTVVTWGDLGALWDLITSVTDNGGILIGVIILVVVLAVVRKFGTGLGSMLNIGGKQ